MTAGPQTLLSRIAHATSGYVLVGVSAFGYLAVGPRVLGTDQFAVMAVAWTLVSLFTGGIAQPTERALIQSGGTAVPLLHRPLLAWVLLGALIPIGGLLGLDPLLSNQPIWEWGVVAGILAGALLVPLRANSVGRKQFGRYGRSLQIEAATRIVVASSAMLLPTGGEVLLSAALALPSLAAIGYLWLGDSDAPAADPTQHQSSAFIVIALTTQLIVVAGVLGLQWSGADPIITGTYVILGSYLRIPILLLAGATVVLIADYARLHREGQLAVLYRRVGRAGVWEVTITTAALAVLLLLWPIAGDLLYGPQATVPTGTVLGLALVTLTMVLLASLTRPIMATGRAWTAASLWGFASGTVCLAVLGSVPNATWVAFGTAASVGGVAVVTLLLLSNRRSRQRLID